MRKLPVSTTLVSAAILASALIQPSPVSADANMLIDPTQSDAEEFCENGEVSSVFGEAASGGLAEFGIVGLFGLIDPEIGFHCFFQGHGAGAYVFPNSTHADMYDNINSVRKEAVGAGVVYWDNSHGNITLVCDGTLIRVKTKAASTVSFGGVTVEITAGEPITENKKVAMLNMAADVWCPGEMDDILPSGQISFANTLEDLRRMSDYDLGDASAFRLYRAFFNREPEFDGAKYWLEQRRAGVEMVAIAAVFADSDEFRLTYGETNDAEFLRIVYSNVLGREFDQGGYDYWLGQLSSGMSRAELVMYFAVSDEFSTAYPYGSID